MTLRILSLFSGYLGLDLAVQTVLDAETVAVADIKPASCKLLAHRLPDVPNLGDITRVDWPEWAGRVDIITGGSPCQDLSHAGKRAGMTDGTRSNLWVAMREAIATIRPRLVLWENVRGAYSACADSDMGRCPRCVDPSHPGRHAPHLRALGRVLGDLSDLGYDAEWHGIRAADVGAPHGRYRVFVLAWPADLAGDTWGLIDRNRRPAGGLGIAGGAGIVSLLPTPRASDSNGGGLHGTGGLDLRTAIDLLPTPRATDGTKGGPNQRGSSGDLMLPSAVHLLPTPAVNDMGEGKTVEAWDEWTARMKSSHGNGNGHGASLHIESLRSDKWGQYAPAIARWEAVLGRPAPAPTEVSTKSRERCPVHGDPQEGRPGEELRDMREGLDAQEVRQWATGGQGRIPKTPELLSGVREHQGAGHKGRPSLASQEAPEGFVRGLLGHEGFTRSPQGQEPREQRCGEPRNALCELPPEAALEGGPREADARESVGESCACKRRLSPEFVSWMMGLPAGWITDVPGITRNEALSLCGDGVVPHQGAAALSLMLDRARQAVAS